MVQNKYSGFFAKAVPDISGAAFLLMIVFISHTACSEDIDIEQSIENTVFIPTYSLKSLDVSNEFAPPESLGQLNNPEINEASGLTECKQNPDLLWTHNDSGDAARIFLIHKNGNHKGTFRLLNSSNRDWEDMASGPGPEQGITYLYIGDIGDNGGKYAVKHIYRIPEPDIKMANLSLRHLDVSGAEQISFVYPDNKMVDAETLMVDPRTKDIFIVTKREFPVTVYQIPFPQNTRDTIVAREYAQIPINRATGGDFSHDGSQIILRTYEKAFLWSRENHESTGDALMKLPIRVPLASDPKGEAITFSRNGSGYYTVSEKERGIIPEIYFIKSQKESIIKK